eukprot:121545-Rhodomonas_salina.3
MSWHSPYLLASQIGGPVSHFFLDGTKADDGRLPAVGASLSSSPSRSRRTVIAEAGRSRSLVT